jgi:hypothetical protein
MTSSVNRTPSTFETDENFNLRLDLDPPAAGPLQIPIWAGKRKSVCERVSDSVSERVHSFVNAVSTSSIYQGVQEGASLFSIAARNRLAHRLQRRRVADASLERVAEGNFKRQKRESTHSIAPPNISPIEKLPKVLRELIVQYLSPTNFDLISKKWAELLPSYYRYIVESYRTSPLVTRYISGSRIEGGKPKFFIQEVWDRVLDFPRRLSIPSLHLFSVERAIQDKDFFKVFSEIIRNKMGDHYEKASEFDSVKSSGNALNWNTEVEKFKKDLKEMPRSDLIERIYGIENLPLIAQELVTLPDELRFFTNLKNLWLDSNPKLDFNFLSSFPKLQRLNLRDCNLRDISFLSKLGDLKCLNLSENPITDLGEVARLTDLKVLILNRIKQINIQHLIPLNKIETFESSGSDYVNLDLIGQLPEAIRKEIESRIGNGKV